MLLTEFAAWGIKYKLDIPYFEYYLLLKNELFEAS